MRRQGGLLGQKPVVQSVKILKIAMEVVRENATLYKDSLEERYNFVRRVVTLTEKTLFPASGPTIQLDHFGSLKRISRRGGETLYVTRIGGLLFEVNEDGSLKVYELPEHFQKKKFVISPDLMRHARPILEVGN